MLEVPGFIELVVATKLQNEIDRLVDAGIIAAGDVGFGDSLVDVQISLNVSCAEIEIGFFVAEGEE